MHLYIHMCVCSRNIWLVWWVSMTGCGYVCEFIASVRVLVFEPCTCECEKFVLCAKELCVGDVDGILVIIY